MKSIIPGLMLVSILFVSSCGSEDDLVCSVNSVTISDNASTNFNFSRKSDGSAQLNLVTVYEGTDSSYTFSYTYSSSGSLTNIIRNEDGVTLNYEVSYDGDNVSSFLSKNSSGVNQDELRLVYSGGRVSQTQAYLANSSGTLFQVGHNTYSYDGDGNLTARGTYLDLASIFSLLFGFDPATYSPLLLDNATFQASSYANPLNGHYFMDNFDLCLMVNLPQKITYTTKTENYSFDSDGSGLPTKATAGSKSIEMVYTCQ